MPVNRDNTLIVSGRAYDFQHGVYNFHGLEPRGPGLRQLFGKILPAHEYIVIWFGEPPEGQYPYSSAFQAQMVAGNGAAEMPNGGLRMDMDFSVGTYGLYKINREEDQIPTSCNFMFWADFDHWPVDEGGHLMPGLGNGHVHKKSKISVQDPVNDRMREILYMVHLYK